SRGNWTIFTIARSSRPTPSRGLRSKQPRPTAHWVVSASAASPTAKGQARPEYSRRAGGRVDDDVSRSPARETGGRFASPLVTLDSMSSTRVRGPASTAGAGAMVTEQAGDSSGPGPRKQATGSGSHGSAGGSMVGAAATDAGRMAIETRPATIALLGVWSARTAEGMGSPEPPAQRRWPLSGI